jgi:cytochrome c-type biogenesis protein CcmH
LITALMVAVALALLLGPLLRGSRRANPGTNPAARLRALDAALEAGVIDAGEYARKRELLRSEPVAPTPDAARPRSRHALGAAIAVALLLPAGTLLLYRLIGSPEALHPVAATAADGAPPDHGPGMEQAITQLAAKLKQQPDDIDGWSLLGRAYQATQRFAEARDAFGHALDLAPNDPDLMVEYAQAMALATPDHRLAGKPRELIDKALGIAPANQRGLWLSGIGDYQEGRYKTAITTWNRLLPQLPKGSDLAASVAAQIADAQALAAGKPLPSQAAPAATSAAPALAATAPSAQADGSDQSAAAGAAHLAVEVVLDPKLANRVAPGDTLFVYAKAASGPPMPLAIQRMSAGKLPVTVTLDDSMGMLPSMKLSMFPQIVIGARISKSGKALAQSGDLQTLSTPVDVHRTEPVHLTIDTIVP